MLEFLWVILWAGYCIYTQFSLFFYYTNHIFFCLLFFAPFLLVYVISSGFFLWKENTLVSVKVWLGFSIYFHLFVRKVLSYILLALVGLWPVTDSFLKSKSDRFIIFVCDFFGIIYSGILLESVSINRLKMKNRYF